MIGSSVQDLGGLGALPGVDQKSKLRLVSGGSQESL